jgi:drug/metabolite transporter (DMT)-like permease
MRLAPVPPRDAAAGSASKGEGGGASAATAGPRSIGRTLLIFAPISMFVVLGKLATYASYGTVSMSLTHTAKALEPVFNVLLSGLLFRELRSCGVYTSLLPIAMGVWLASSSEVTFNVWGFSLATLSAAMKVLDNIYTKRVMNTEHFTFFEIHFWCGVASIVTLTPVLLAQLLLSPPGTTAGGGGGGGERLVPSAGDDGGMWGSLTSLPLASMLVSSFLQYSSSLSSYMVLSLVTHLTFAVVNSMKRLTIILAGIVYFGLPWNVWNILGVFVAVGGVFLYNLAKDARAQHEVQEALEGKGGAHGAAAGSGTAPAALPGTGRSLSPAASHTLQSVSSPFEHDLAHSPSLAGSSPSSAAAGATLPAHLGRRGFVAADDDQDDGNDDEEGGPVTPGVHHLGLRRDGLFSSDDVRASRDPSYAGDIPRTESFG